MKLRHPHYPPERRRRHPSASEVIRVPEREANQGDRLVIISQRMHGKIVREVELRIENWTSSKQEYFNLVAMVASLDMLRSALNHSVVNRELEEKAKSLVKSHELFTEPFNRSMLNKAGTPRILFWSDVVSVFPEERSRLQIPDDIFSQWLTKYAGDKKLHASFKAQLFARMAILKPDRLANCQQRLLEIQPSIWDAGLKRMSLRDLAPMAACRLLQPDLELSDMEKSQILDLFELDDPFFPLFLIEALEGAAILVSPKVELSPQGKVVFSRKSPAIDQPIPLPDRPQV